jgi:hypothetical protein
MEKHIQLTQITPVEIPQHASACLSKQTTITTVKPTKESMAWKDHVDQPIKFLLQLAYSANKGLRWRKKRLGLVESDGQDERFRQCLLSKYLSLKAYFQVERRRYRRMHPTSIQREEMMVSGQVKLKAAIHTPVLTFVTLLGTCQSTCCAPLNVDIIEL